MTYKLRHELTHDTGDFLGDLLFARGIDCPEEWCAGEEYLLPLENLDNIEQGVRQLYWHLKQGNQIFLQVDDDCDGFTSASIIYNYIQQWFPEANIIWRVHEGKQHGVILDTIPENTKLIIIPDAGSSQYEEHRILKKRGIDVLIIDHHLSEYESYDAIVINNQLSEKYDNKTLSGSAMTLRFCQMIDKIFEQKFSEDYYDLAAIGIIADVMDLRHLETRYIVKRGLSNIKNPALRAFAEKNAYSIKDTENLSPIDVAFYIGPLMNAMIRMGSYKEKQLMFEAFISEPKTVQSTKKGAKEGDTEIFAEQIARLATNAKSRQQRLIDQAIEQLNIQIFNNNLLDNKILMIEVGEEEVDSRLTGLIAMKLSAKYGRPTILVRKGNDGCVKGSIRNYNGSPIDNFRQFLEDTKLFEFVQGHASAAGLSIKEKKVLEFIDYSNDLLKDTIFDTTDLVDYIFAPDELALQHFIMQIGDKNFWGMGVEEPVIAVENIRISSEDVKMMKNNSMKFTYNNISYCTFKNPKACEDFQKYGVMIVTITGKCNVNEYMGNISPQIFIQNYNIENGMTSF